MDVLLAIHQSDLRLAIDLFLREEPGIYVVGVARETEGLIALLRTVRPDLLIVDWELPGRPLADVLAEAGKPDRPPKIIGLVNDERVKKTALAAKADVIVVKGEPPGQLRTAIRQLGTPPKPAENEETA